MVVRSRRDHFDRHTSEYSWPSRHEASGSHLHWCVMT